MKQRMVAVHNIQQSNTSRAAGGDNSSEFVERRVGASTMRRSLPPMFPNADDKGTTVHCRERHPPSPEDEIGNCAWLGWLWEARSWGSESVMIWRLLRDASTMRRSFE